MANQDKKIHDLLALLRADFLDQLAHHCVELEQLILALSSAKDNKTNFDELFRLIHNLKGAGGTHGLPLITSICHLFEDNLAVCHKQQDFGRSFVDNSLALIDLLRQVKGDHHFDSDKVIKMLDQFRLIVQRNVCSIMVLDASKVMPVLLEKTFNSVPVQASIMVDGLQALNRLLYEPFDVLVVSSNLLTLNGLAVVCALRANGGMNARTPVLFYNSSGKVNVPLLSDVKCFRKTPDLAKQLATEILQISKHSP